MTTCLQRWWLHPSDLLMPRSHAFGLVRKSPRLTAASRPNGHAAGTTSSFQDRFTSPRRVAAAAQRGCHSHGARPACLCHRSAAPTCAGPVPLLAASGTSMGLLSGHGGVCRKVSLRHRLERRWAPKACATWSDSGDQEN